MKMNYVSRLKFNFLLFLKPSFLISIGKDLFDRFIVFQLCLDVCQIVSLHGIWSVRIGEAAEIGDYLIDNVCNSIDLLFCMDLTFIVFMETFHMLI